MIYQTVKNQSEWLTVAGTASCANGSVVTSVPVVIEHEGSLYAGWKWSDGVTTFAHNFAGNAWKLASA